MNRPLVVVSILLVAAPISAGTQLDSTRDACAELSAADARLNRVYRDILERYRGEASFLAKLKSAQRAWIAFRDLELEALYPAVDKRTAYGSIYPMCRCAALTDLTVDRVEQLESWLSAPEGDACGGSRQP